MNLRGLGGRAGIHKGIIGGILNLSGLSALKGRVLRDSFLTRGFYSSLSMANNYSDLHRTIHDLHAVLIIDA